MHHWDPTICQRAVECVNVKTKPPTLTDPRRIRTQSRGIKLGSSRDIKCSCCSFTSPSRESYVLFDVRPTCSSDESGVECVGESSAVVCSALSDPHGHTLSLCLSIDCCNQTAGCSQVVWECHAIFHFSTCVGWNTPIFCSTRTQRMRAQVGKKKQKANTKASPWENTIPCSKRIGQTFFW